MEITTNDIFKFAPINAFTFKNLLLSQLWFSPPTSMNDQLEGLIRIKNMDFKPSPKAIKNFIKSKNIEQYFRYPEKTIKEEGFIKSYMDYWFFLARDYYGICCFSRNPKESLMWSHYANKHEGICIIYDREVLLDSLNNIIADFFKCYEINYENRPVIELVENNYQISYLSNDPLITFKNPNWKYENEVRIVFNTESEFVFKGRAMLIDHSAIKGIIYGAHMDEEDIDSISYILRNEPLYHHVKEFNANLDYNSGEIYFTPD